MRPANVPWGRSLWSLALLLAVVSGGFQAYHWWQREQLSASIQSRAQSVPITLYTTSTCPYCAQAKVWLDGHQVRWTECNIELDQTCQAAFNRQGAPGVPLMRVGDQWHLGFDVAWLDQALQSVTPDRAR